MFDDNERMKRKGNTLLAMLVIVSLMLGMLMGFGGVRADVTPAFTNSPATSDLVGVPYRYAPTFNVTLDTTWRFYGNSPSWASWSTTNGIVTGTPTAPGTYSFVYYIANYGNTRVYQNFTVTVASPSPIPTYTNFPPLGGTKNVAYSYTPTFNLPTDPAWRFYGIVPTWGRIDSMTGVVSGTPTAAGAYNFQMYLLTFTGGKVFNNWTVTVLESRWAVQITNSPSTTGIINVPYVYSPTFNTTIQPGWRFYGTVTYWATFASWDSPIAHLGNVTGTPPALGVFYFSYYLTNTAGGMNTYLNWTVTVGSIPSPVFIQSMSLNITDVGSHFSYTPRTNISSAITVLEMPSWMTYHNGVLSGTPSDIGRYKVRILAISTVYGTSMTQTFDIQVNPQIWPALQIQSMWLSVIPVFFLMVIGLVCAVSREGFSVTVFMSSIAIGIGLLTWKDVLPTWTLIVTGIIIALMLFRAQDSEVISIGR